MRGIYAITNVLTDTVYYGQSFDICDRAKMSASHTGTIGHPQSDATRSLISATRIARYGKKETP